MKWFDKIKRKIYNSLRDEYDPIRYERVHVTRELVEPVAISAQAFVSSGLYGDATEKIVGYAIENAYQKIVYEMLAKGLCEEYRYFSPGENGWKIRVVAKILPAKCDKV